MRKEGRLSEELMSKINAILNKEIDPIFFQLTERIDKRIANSEFVPWLLAHKMDVENAKVVLALPDENWTKETGEFKCSKEFAEKLGIDREKVNAIIAERYFSGEVVWTENGGKTPPSCGLWIDLQNSRRFFEKNGDAYYKILGFFVENEVSKIDQEIAREMHKVGKMGQARIVPRYDSVKNYEGLLPAENVKEIFKSRKLVAQNQCACRIRYPELNLDPYVCACFNDTAKLSIKMEIGREIPWEEAFEYIQKRGKIEPHCHINKHTDNLEEIGDVFCSCHSDVCVLLKSAVTLGSEFKVWDYYGKSRFMAVVDPEKCVNCGLCRNKRCMFDAIDIRYQRKVLTEKHFIIEESCMGCGCCAETCPKGAIKMVCVRPPEFLKGKKLDVENANEEIATEGNIRPGADLSKL